MNNRIATLALGAGFATLLYGCSSGVNASQPNAVGAPLAAQGKLQFAVGTANFPTETDLNVVATLRNAQGFSAYLVNTPTISGPFVNNNPATSATGAVVAGSDAGTNKISGSPQVVGGPSGTSFGQSGGVFGTGFAPANSATSQLANYPQIGGASNNFIYADNTSVLVDGPAKGTLENGAPVAAQGIFNTYPEPLFGRGSRRYPMLLGSSGPTSGVPAFPTGVTGFLGYPVGMTAFSNVPPVASTTPYNLSVQVASAQSPGITVSANATMAALTVLPLMPEPAFVGDGTGGGTVTVGTSAGVTEGELFVVDVCVPQNPGTGACANGRTANAVSFYTFPYQPGTTTITVPNNLYIDSNGAKAASFATGDVVFVYAAGYDFPAFEAAVGTSQTPTITGANGTADFSMSTIQETTY